MFMKFEKRTSLYRCRTCHTVNSILFINHMTPRSSENKGSFMGWVLFALNLKDSTLKQQQESAVFLSYCQVHVPDHAWNTSLAAFDVSSREWCQVTWLWPCVRQCDRARLSTRRPFMSFAGWGGVEGKPVLAVADGIGGIERAGAPWILPGLHPS